MELVDQQNETRTVVDCHLLAKTYAHVYVNIKWVMCQYSVDVDNFERNSTP